MLKSLHRQFENIVVLDIETTGFNSKTDEIIEIAALRVSSCNNPHHIEDELNVLIHLSAGKRIPQKITDLTGITEQMLQQGGEPKEAVCKKVVEILSHPKTLVAAYNAQFDLCFLYHFLSLHKRSDVLKQVKMLDAMTIYKDRRDYPHKLCDAVAAYNLEYQSSHRAMDDARATLALLVAMEAERGDLDRYLNLFGYNPKYGVSGSRISSITYLPQGYDRRRRLYEVSS